MKSATGFLNDCSQSAPLLKIYLNLDTLTDLRPGSEWPGLDSVAAYERLKADGFEGVQVTFGEPPAAEAATPYCGLDRISTPAEADGIAARHAARGDQCITVHVGWGLEDDDEVACLIEAVLTASDRHHLPIFIETHRATVTQDIWRTGQITRRFPEVRFNGDFSHYYCGQELVYGDWETKLAFLEPVFERVGFMHGRIASPGCMQVPIEPDLSSLSASTGAVDYVRDFRELWIRAMSGFLSQAGPGDILIFAPELLASSKSYARQFRFANDKLVEETDRYEQALLLKRLAIECFAQAKSNLCKEVSA